MKDPGCGGPAPGSPAAGVSAPSARAAAPSVHADRLVAALLAWFAGRSRDVPWRGERDPYRIWVAEVMAQQTRIDTVRRYYGPFLERFPDAQTLADAELDEVLKAWEGLGYYARARRLRSAAREVVAEYGGRLPEDPDRLRALPGIGAYTAGAIASLAFGLPEPAVDGNVRRVLSRLFDLAAPTPASLERRARLLVEARAREAGSVNQALMDLGSELCTPASPSCGSCPVADGCLALARGTVAERPPVRSRRPLPHHVVATAVVWRDDRLLITRRPPEGLLGGLWEFPGGKVEAEETPAEAARRELNEELGIEVEIGEPLATVEHAYSHFRITLHAFHARLVAGEPRPAAADALAWVRPAELAGYAFPAANLRLIQRLRDDERRPRSSSG